MPLALRALIGAVAVLVLGGPAVAATATGSLSVRVVVQPSCTVSGATLDFGTYTSGQAKDLTGFTRIGFSGCPVGDLRFELDGGTNGTPRARKLSDGRSGLLNYALHRDSARTQNFGEGGDARTIALATPGSGNVSVYGTIPAQQIVSAGTYTDTVVITLTF
jgi:spore coat protein U-like protein